MPPRKGDIYRVRRVFHFRNEVKMFDIAPPLEARLLLTPTTFMAAPRYYNDGSTIASSRSPWHRDQLSTLDL